MLINTNVYPQNTRMNTDNIELIMSYSLGELINKHTYNWNATPQEIETDYTFPNSQESSNVYGWMDENCVFMNKRSNISTDLSTGVMTMESLPVGAGNLRMMFRTDYPTDGYYDSNNPLYNKQSNTRYDCETTDNNEFYNSSTTHGYSNSYVPIIRMRYDRLILFTLIRVTITNMRTGSISSFGISLDAVKSGHILNYTLKEEKKNELITTGHTIFDMDDAIITLSGVIIKPYYGSNAGTPDRKIASIAPTIETNMSNSVWFGCPTQTFVTYNGSIEPGLTYYNSAWIGGLENNGTNISAPLDYTSLSMMNMSKDYSFGVSDTFTIDMLNGTDYAAYTPHFTNNLCFVKYPSLNATCVCTYYTLEDCMNMVASYGLYFCFDETLINEKLGQDLINDDIYLGKMYENGRCDGTYTSGSATLTEPQAQDDMYIVSYLESDSIMEVEPLNPDEPYVPPTPPTPPGRQDEGDIGYNRSIPAGISAFTTNYILSAGALTKLGSDLWAKVSDPDDGMITNFFNIKTSDGTFPPPAGDTFQLTLSNIIDYFVSLKYFPFNLPDYVSNHASNPVKHIKIGSSREAISTDPYNSLIADTSLVVLDGGSVNIPTKFNSFLDHEPYASVSVYVPYCGTVSLQPSIIRGASLTLVYGVDLNTGGCQATLVKSGDGASFPIATINGTMGFNILLTGNNAQTVQANANNAYNSAVLQQQMNTASTFLDAGIATAMGNYGGAVSSGVNNILKNVNIAMNYANDRPQLLGTSPLTAGSTSIIASLISPQTAYVQIRYRKPNLDGYDLLGGLADRSEKISNVTGSGFVRIINLKLTNLKCTADELNMIKETLAAGIWT